MNPGRKYKITARPKLLIRDEESVKFHVASNDYFGTATTLLRLIRQELSRHMKKASTWAPIEKAFKNLEGDLSILQENYHIKANRKATQAGAKGRLNSQ